MCDPVTTIQGQKPDPRIWNQTLQRIRAMSPIPLPHVHLTSEERAELFEGLALLREASILSTE